MSETNCIALPAETLAVRDWSDSEHELAVPKGKGKPSKPKMIEPRAGDPVEFRVRGSVEKVEGGVAHVRIAFVNDKRAEAPKAAEASGDEAEEDNETAMRKLAKTADDSAEEEE